MSKVPNAEQAYIDPRKVSGYLLSRSHSRGSDKAAFFERFGFIATRGQELVDALKQHVEVHDVVSSSVDRFGHTYKVLGELRTPDGRNPQVLVTWIVLARQVAPRLVTAVPGKDPRK